MGISASANAEQKGSFGLQTTLSHKQTMGVGVEENMSAECGEQERAGHKDVWGSKRTSEERAAAKAASSRRSRAGSHFHGPGAAKGACSRRRCGSWLGRPWRSERRRQVCLDALCTDADGGWHRVARQSVDGGWRRRWQQGKGGARVVKRKGEEDWTRTSRGFWAADWSGRGESAPGRYAHADLTKVGTSVDIEYERRSTSYAPK